MATLFDLPLTAGQAGKFLRVDPTELKYIWDPGVPIGGAYQFVDSGGVPQIQRNTINFTLFFTVSDDPLNLWTNVDLDVTFLANDTTFVNALIANATFTTNLAGDNNFTTTLAGDTNFITTLAANNNFSTALISNSFFTTNLAGDNNFTTTLAGDVNFITTLTSNPTFQGDIVTIINNSGGSLTIDLATQVGVSILPLANGGTGSALTDPGANMLWGWDDTDNSIGFWTIGNGLTYDHPTHTLNGLFLQTNGVANTDQTLLNLVAGTNVALTDNGLGTVTIDATTGTGDITSVAEEDLVPGDTVAFATNINGRVIKAAWATRDQDTGIAGGGEIECYCNVGGDKYVFVYSGSGVNNFSVVVGTLNQNTKTWSFGTPLDNAYGLQDGISITKVDTDKVLITHINDGDNNNVRSDIGVVTGTSIAFSGGAVIFNNGSSFAFPICTQLDTDIAAVYVSRSAGFENQLIAVDTSGVNPATIDVIDLTNFASGSNSGEVVIEKIATNKIVAGVGNEVIAASFSGGFAGTWTQGAAALTISNSISFSASAIKSVASDTFFIITDNGAGVTVDYCTAVGTVLSTGGTITIGSASITRALLAKDGTNVYSWDDVAGLYTVSWNGSSIDTVPSITPLTFTSTGVVESPVASHTADSDLGYFSIMFSSQISGNMNFHSHIQGFSDKFIGIVQTTSARGAAVTVKTVGIDTNQTGLNSGSYYDPFQGGLLVTPTQGFDSMQAQSPTDILI